MSASVDTCLFDFTSKRISDATSELFNKLKSAVTETKRTVCVHTPFNYEYIGSDMDDEIVSLFKEVFKGFDFYDSINQYKTWISLNENHSDVIIVTFDETNKNGLIVIENKGVYYISGSTYSWRGVQDLDLYISFREDGSLQLDSLK